MQFVVNILKTLGIAKPNPALYRDFQKSVETLSKSVTELKGRLSTADAVCNALAEDDTEKAVEAVLKGIKLKTVSDTMKKLQDALDKGDLKAGLKAIPKKNLYKEILKALENVIDDIPDLVDRSAKLAEEGAGLVENIQNSGDSGLTLTVTVMDAKPLVDKSKKLASEVEGCKTEAEKLKESIAKLQAKAEEMPAE